MASVGEAKTSLEARDKSFFIDGKEIMLLSGAMHYFRVVPEYWRDRMIRMKACGLNTLETYVPWNLHEEVKGEFNFEGILNVRKFVQLAHELGLYVLFRPGPYICSEWEFGGLPSWLLSDPKMEVRAPYKPYLDAVDRFFTKLLAEVVDLQYSKGGPIIAVQLENEYGSYGDNEEYKTFLKELVVKCGINELLFTSDNGMGVKKGNIPGALLTVNYQEKDHGYLLYEYLKNVKQPGKPLMVMEFWTGWFDHWGSKHEIWPTESFEEVLRWIMSQKSSVNFYMMHGGTNFGFMNGANQDVGATNVEDEPYSATITSYDYDAPISENGDIAPKAHKIKEIFEQTAKQYLVDVPDFPANIAATAYGDISEMQYIGFSDMLKHVKPIESKDIVAMEMLPINNGGGQGYGYVLYRKVIQKGGALTISGTVRDRAQIFIDNKEVAVLDSNKSDNVIQLAATSSPTCLDILVENQGRVNYAGYRSDRMNLQRKGLQKNVLLDGEVLNDWQIYPMEFKAPFIDSVGKTGQWSSVEIPNGPCFVRTSLNISDAPTDTYLNMKAWTKGTVFVNGFNLGRYWNIGPQETLYLPGPLLKTGKNEILIFEQDSVGAKLQFSAEAHLGETVIHTTWLENLNLNG